MRFVKALSATMIGRGGVLVKGSRGRSLYDDARACIRVYRKGRQNCLRRKDYFFHASYGNLSSGVFHVLMLKPFELTVLGEGLTTVTSSVVFEKPIHLWGVFDEIDVSKDWDLEVWAFSDSERLLPVDFAP